MSNYKFTAEIDDLEMHQIKRELVQCWYVNGSYGQNLVVKTKKSTLFISGEKLKLDQHSYQYVSVSRIVSFGLFIYVDSVEEMDKNDQFFKNLKLFVATQ